MKKFILKSILYFFLGIVSVIIFLIFTGTFGKNQEFNFVSNSISFNAKSAFIYKNYTRLSHADFVILGSSMSLNNIDGLFLEKFTEKKVINISSWGMKIKNFKDFLPHIKPNAEVIINLNFNDFGEPWLEKYLNYPIGDNNEYFNKTFNRLTYQKQCELFEEYTNDSANRNYKCLIFDQTGGVLLQKEKFNISIKRWEDAPSSPTEEELENLLNQLEILANHKVYLFFSPERMKYKSQSKVRAISEFERNLKKKFNNINFSNFYNLEYPDSLFVDCTHFNNCGARNYTQLIVNQVNSCKSNNTHQESN
jgi:hypothetical protein